MPVGLLSGRRTGTEHLSDGLLPPVSEMSYLKEPCHNCHHDTDRNQQVYTETAPDKIIQDGVNLFLTDP